MFNHTTDHFLFENGQVRAYERRRRYIITDSRGMPRRTIPDGVGWQQRMRMKGPDEKIVESWVLVPVTLGRCYQPD